MREKWEIGLIIMNAILGAVAGVICLPIVFITVVELLLGHVEPEALLVAVLLMAPAGAILGLLSGATMEISKQNNLKMAGLIGIFGGGIFMLIIIFIMLRDLQGLLKEDIRRTISFFLPSFIWAALLFSKGIRLLRKQPHKQER